jgi:tRNA pseudouridine55 synthase
MEGILNVLKPPGMTSHDVVSFLRRTLGERRIGHSGTLDPQAAGVLPVCIGRATRLAEYIGMENKSYFCEMTLGKATDTQDAWGKVISDQAIPPLDLAGIKDVAGNFLGKIKQKVPDYSAVKVAGQPLYKAARRGDSLEPIYRFIEIYKLDILDYQDQKIRFWVKCGKGTYVRALCQDLGEALGTTGYMSFLVRTSVGSFTLADSYTLEEIAQHKEKLLMPMERGVAELPKAVLTDSQVRQIFQGQSVSFSENTIQAKAPEVVCTDSNGRLAAICQWQAGRLMPKKVFK